MKRRFKQTFIIFLLVATVATIGAVPAMTNQKRTPFTGTEFMGPVIDPGKTTIKNGKIYIEGMVQLAQDKTSDPRTSGEGTIKINAILDAKTFAGEMWGTFTLKNSEGEWTGSWSGRKNAKGYSFVRGNGEGEGGYKGLSANWRYTRLNPDTMAPMDIRGVIFQKSQ